MVAIDILVNNAGITADGLLIRMKDEDWDKVIDINLSASMRLTRQVIRGMLKRKIWKNNIYKFYCGSHWKCWSK